MALTVPFVDLTAVHTEVGAELEAAVSRVVASGRYLLGPELERFEHEFAGYCGTAHCVGVGSGLSAIELSLRAAGVGPGDEVIVPAYTFIATWLAVSRVGARPVPADVRERTYNIDPDCLAAAVTPRTAAVVPVHLRGEPAEMEEVDAIARRSGLAVIEDAAQAHGARYDGRRAGSLGLAGAFSFYPSKNLGALGDGGAVTTDDDELAARVRLLRNYGMRVRYEVETAGANSRLGEIQAAALSAKLPHLDRWNAARRALAGRYLDTFAGAPELTTPEGQSRSEPVWHLFVINRDDRDVCATALRERGIETGIHYPVLPHLSRAYAGEGGPAGSFPVAERLAATTLSLPIYPQLEPDRCDAVAAAVRNAA
ncbi:MAG TPA: DegT/DnrJ/EryC1/StrS family aminotransferase [Solirubrobacterales bacterium]|nr:DegT/DnrJ/EryC1/StrS family aminotransferase [Solirubrobacterales bacterium]